MAGEPLLDTSVVVGLFRNREHVVEKFKEVNGVAVSVVVLGELYLGALKSVHRDVEMAKIEQLMLDSTVLQCDTTTAMGYAKIKQELSVKGKPIPENDVWIAAQAIQYELTLITSDEHYKNVDGLVIEKW